MCGLAKNDGLRRSGGDLYRIVYFQLLWELFFSSFLFFSAVFDSMFENYFAGTAVVFPSSLVFFTHELGAPEPGQIGVKRKDPFFFR